MENDIFRKTSLDRLSSPEELGQYVRALKPMSWLLLAGILIVVAGVCVWGFAGIIPETVEITGVTFAQAGEAYTVYSYLPLNVAKRLEVGMKAQVSPDYAAREEYGYIYGTVARIGENPVIRQDLEARYGDLSYVEGLIPAGNAVEVEIALSMEDEMPAWSNEKGRKVTLEQGTTCGIFVVIRERRPANLIFGG